uniref:phenylalanine--tRNA ligase n=1 Tax=Polytomella parva TaxID=51329 RepID=A0A7S0YCZ8_9CHLO|mmetsp:Transcript_1816/g.2636  ORF Transcript_1816/g.2636 Transcript_1816/m.2636 type:complete len:495 (+) Transcript_1816:47-1531(+)
MEEYETKLLLELDAQGIVKDSGVFCAAHNVDHAGFVGTIKSLIAAEMIVTKDIDHSKYVLTEDGKSCLANGSPEAIMYGLVPAEGLPLASLKTVAPGEVGEVGYRQAMQNKWLSMDKSGAEPLIVRKIDSIEDKVQSLVKEMHEGRDISKADLETLTKRRKMVKLEQWKTYEVEKGPKFATERKKPATDMLADMVAKGTWKSQEFKAYNFNAMGRPITGGHLHPLLKVRSQFRKIFTQMGFEEMPTNNYVESSFWNFDALFQPQQHPARDAHDTFFLNKPATTVTFPEEYLERVRKVHEDGGYGSMGYGYYWKRAEAEKNLLRTHTTAVSSRMLYKLAQGGFRPVKYFSIDRVFRNEAVDRTHLAEFHQVEGLICDRGLKLGDLIGTLQQFFTRLGLRKLRFKPAYNPYTEPSMEIFSYSEQLGKWIEVGNSGMFRPEMLRPMGLPADVNVIAWGLSVERPTMILYGIDNIRDLFGHKVSLSMVRRNPICRLGL